MAIFLSSFADPLSTNQQDRAGHYNIRDLRMCHPCNLGRKTLNMGLLLLKNVFGHEQGECAISNSAFLNPIIEPVAYLLPDKPRCRLEAVSSNACTEIECHEP